MYTVDTNGDGNVDSIQIKVLNLIIPFAIPEEIEIGDFSLKDFNSTSFDISQYGKFLLDDSPLDFTKESFNIDNVENRLLIYHKGESFKLNDILQGKLSGRLINVGDSISLLIKIDDNTAKKFTEGEHAFRIESDFITNLEITFELDETNMNIKFDPANA
ncbi:MAG: hypothetical protein ACFFE5_12965 [Candidatus Thorarchaeota archaeon]